MEKVPNSHRPGLLGGMYLLSKSPFFKRDPQRNTRLVWDETIRIMFDLFDNVWGDKPEIVLDHCLDITLPVGEARALPHTLSDVSFRLLFLSLALQVYIICSSFSFSPSNWSRVRSPGHVDIRLDYSPWSPDDFQGCASHRVSTAVLENNSS